jgi:hypothetical protein
LTLLLAQVANGIDYKLLSSFPLSNATWSFALGFEQAKLHRHEFWWVILPTPFYHLLKQQSLVI